MKATKRDKKAHSITFLDWIKLFLILSIALTSYFALNLKSEVKATEESKIYTPDVIGHENEPSLEIIAITPPPILVNTGNGAGLDIRTINGHEYYKNVKANESLKPWLEFGIWTRDTEEIRAKARELYDSDTVTFPDGSSRYFEPTEDPILDFVRKSLVWTASIDGVGTSEDQIYYHQIPADEVLTLHKGLCDEASILWVSMARSLGIPARVVAHTFARTDVFYDPYRPLEAHAEAQVWLKYNGTYQWVNIDPSYGWLRWAANGEDITYKDTEWYRDIEKW